MVIKKIEISSIYDYMRQIASVGLKNMVKLQGCMVNALVPEVDERRDKLR